MLSSEVFFEGSAMLKEVHKKMHLKDNVVYAVIKNQITDQQFLNAVNYIINHVKKLYEADNIIALLLEHKNVGNNEFKEHAQRYARIKEDNKIFPVLCIIDVYKNSEIVKTIVNLKTRLRINSKKFDQGFREEDFLFSVDISLCDILKDHQVNPRDVTQCIFENQEWSEPLSQKDIAGKVKVKSFK